MTIAEVTAWDTTIKGNIAHHPTGPAGDRAVQTSTSFRELQAAIARFNASPSFPGPLGATTIIVSSDNPWIRLFDEAVGAAANNKQWEIITTNEELVIRPLSDVGAANNPSLAITRTLNVTDQINFSAANMLFQGSGGGATTSNFTGNLDVSGAVFFGAGNLNLDSAAGIASINGGLTLTGAFTSLGIDDNATAERVQIGDTVTNFGGVGIPYSLSLGVNDNNFIITSGPNGLGGNIHMSGNSHATNPGDVRLRSGSNVWMLWDESVGDLEILTGIGAKTSALTIDATQGATFAGRVDVTGEVITLTNAGNPRFDISDSGSSSTLRLAAEGATLVVGSETNHVLVLQTNAVQAIEIDTNQKSKFKASAAAAASINLAEGTAPTSPVDGDVWVTTTDIIARVNGVSESLVGGISLQTPTVTTSGTAVNYTSIPAGVKRITIMFEGVSGSGTSNPILQLGDAGGIEATGYLGASSDIWTTAATTNHNTGFLLLRGTAGFVIYHGCVVLNLLDSSTHTWVCHGNMGMSDQATSESIGGSKDLTAELDRIRITHVNGTDTFDAGKVNISWEF